MYFVFFYVVAYKNSWTIIIRICQIPSWFCVDKMKKPNYIKKIEVMNSTYHKVFDLATLLVCVIITFSSYIGKIMPWSSAILAWWEKVTWINLTEWTLRNSWDHSGVERLCNPLAEDATWQKSQGQASSCAFYLSADSSFSDICLSSIFFLQYPS